MKNNYFLHTKSLESTSFDNFKIGMSKLIELKIDYDSYDYIHKNNNIYYIEHYLTLCSEGSEYTTAIFKYIEQSNTHPYDINNDDDFEKEFPLYNVGFLGINFSGINDIAIERQITNEDSLHNCKTYYLKKLIKFGSDNDIPKYLSFLFPSYEFEVTAIDDIVYWKNNNNCLIDHIIELLFDVKVNPFVGGIGKTEVLKHKSGMASKRINDEHRITYTLKDGCIQINRCRFHYK